MNWYLNEIRLNSIKQHKLNNLHGQPEVCTHQCILYSKQLEIQLAWNALHESGFTAPPSGEIEKNNKQIIKCKQRPLNILHRHHAAEQYLNNIEHDFIKIKRIK